MWSSREFYHNELITEHCMQSPPNLGVVKSWNKLFSLTGNFITMSEHYKLPEVLFGNVHLK